MYQFGNLQVVQCSGTAGPASSSLSICKILVVAIAVRVGAERPALGLLMLRVNQAQADPVWQLFEQKTTPWLIPCMENRVWRELCPSSTCLGRHAPSFLENFFL